MVFKDKHYVLLPTHPVLACGSNRKINNKKALLQSWSSLINCIGGKKKIMEAPNELAMHFARKIHQPFSMENQKSSF